MKLHMRPNRKSRRGVHRVMHRKGRQGVHPAMHHKHLQHRTHAVEGRSRLNTKMVLVLLSRKILPVVLRNSTTSPRNVHQSRARKLRQGSQRVRISSFICDSHPVLSSQLRHASAEWHTECFHIGTRSGVPFVAGYTKINPGLDKRSSNPTHGKHCMCRAVQGLGF